MTSIYNHTLAMPYHHPEVIALGEQILEAAGVPVISEATARAMDRIGLRREAGLPVPQDAIQAVLYAVAVATSEARQLEDA